MKVHLLKNLIKEAVREVLREELQSTSIEEEKTKYLEITPSVPHTPSTKPVYSTINEALTQTKESMSRQDFANIVGTDSPAVVSSDIISTSGAGIDLSNLDFVSKAAAIFNHSKAKN